MAEVDVFVENFTSIDWELHELWIRGLSAADAVGVMKDRGILNEYPGRRCFSLHQSVLLCAVLSHKYFAISGVTVDLLASDVNDNYRLFAMLENVLLTVGNFKEQLLYQVRCFKIFINLHSKCGKLKVHF